MKILFLDQSGNIGGAERSLLDIVRHYRSECRVVLFQDGAYRKLLEEEQISVQVLSSSDEELQFHRDSPAFLSILSIGLLTRLIAKTVYLSRSYDLIYANTPKAFVVGAFASCFSRRPLVYHLRDLLTREHFSSANIKIIVTLANRLASLVIANSCATQAAFIQAGGRSNLVKVVYNGFDVEQYQKPYPEGRSQRDDREFVVGNFSRLSPWKGQHILLDALTYCPEPVTAWFVGDALFGEQCYVEELHQKIEQLNLSQRVKFWGFRHDTPQLMKACHLVAHTSTAPEPFGRVIAEAMLCGTPVVATAGGGVSELVSHGRTGWLIPPGDPMKLAEIINYCYSHSDELDNIVTQAQAQSRKFFQLPQMLQQLEYLLCQVKDRKT
jgi:glycosyltransferase involved in cell wall biosynthesis